MFEEPKKSTISSPEFPGKREEPSISPVRPQTEIEDIFSKTEGERKTSPLMKGPEKGLEEEIFSPEPSSSKFKWVVIGGIIVLLVGGGYFAYSKMGIGKGIQEETPIIEEEQAPIVPEPISEPEEPTILDSDKDGLTDEEEGDLGTDPFKVDTDQDRIPDPIEVRVYKTDPLNPDSDNDGYLDGEEVKAGYDPKNATPGARLMDLQGEIDKLGE